MIRRVTAVALAAVVSLTLAAPVDAAPLTFPVRVEDGFPRSGPPDVTAPSWILYDEAANQILAAANPEERRAVASTTKIMTALIAVETSDPGELVTVSQRAAETGEREIGLVAGERVTLAALVKAALIHSANDAATAIAEHVGGSVEGFVGMMNRRASELGLSETGFANPHGLDAPGHHSSARDLLELARIAMEEPLIRDVVRSRLLVFPDAPDGTRRIGSTTNLLLGEYEGMEGIKTGFTEQAMLTFVAAAEREGRRLYVVVLGSDGPRAHIEDARALLDYGFGDLGVLGSIVVGSQYVSMKPRIQPPPLLLRAGIESTVHLMAQDLAEPSDVTSGSVVSPPEPDQIVTRRHVDERDGLGDALGHWWRLVQGMLDA